MYYMKYVLLFLIIIIIFNIIYYLYNTKKYIENFTDIKELSGGKIDSRPCTIYVTKDIETCDLMTDYYKKGLTQLDILIYKYSKSNNPTDKNFLESIIQIKENKINNINNCKVELKDWKEFKNYYDINGNPLTDNIILALHIFSFNVLYSKFGDNLISNPTYSLFLRSLSLISIIFLIGV